MSSKTKAKALAEDTEDEDMAAMLQAIPQSESDPNQWVRDKYGDLDWGYTARVVRKWSHDALLTHIWDGSFSIPARDYNPSAPFVYVKLHGGEVITLPHGYRLPLMFVAKYYWGITLSSLKNAQSWKKEREKVFHLSRLCENLFQRARAKAFAGGMEKGWRCLMFDRLLARFYKGWDRNDPPAGKEFLSTFGAKEYDRDVLKHDWKRWCTRGLNGIKMTESEVIEGITVTQFREDLVKAEDRTWRLAGEPLTFITVQEDAGWSSVSELTDWDLDTEEGSDVDGEEESGTTGNTGSASLKGKLPEVAASSEKRSRPLPIDEDDMERASKRARIQASNNEYRSAPHHYLSRTLAAMAKNRLSTATPAGLGPGTYPDFVGSSPRAEASHSLSPPRQSSTASIISFMEEMMPTYGSGSRSSPSNREHSSKSPESVVPTTKPTNISGYSSISANGSSRRPSSTSLKAKPRPRKIDTQNQRTSGSKPRQTRASRLAGVATVNVYVSDGKPRGGAAKAQSKANSKSRRRSPSHEPSKSPFPSVSKPPSAQATSFHPLSTPTPPTRHRSPPDSGSASILAPGPSTPLLQTPVQTLIPAAIEPIPPIVTPATNATQQSLSVSGDIITAKALELLVNLVDAKQVLSNAFHSSSSASSHASGASIDAHQSPDGKYLAFEGRFQNLEDRFSSVKEELKDLVIRLQDLEKETAKQCALNVVNERMLEEKSVDCRPVMMTKGVETDQSGIPGLAMGDVNETAGGRDVDGDVKMDERVLGEMAVQTEPDEEPHRSQQPDSHQEDSSKGEQTPTQDVVLTSVEMRTSDRNCGSETDTDSTVHIVKDDSVDPRAQEMSESLSLLVNNLVSAKMLSVVGDMLKGKARDTAVVDFDASLRPLSPVTTPSSDLCTLTNLLNEIKTLKEESRARDIREKEEMQAMRQLHSAEVDALRRRLSYLESQNHNPEPGDSFSGGQYRSSSSHSPRLVPVRDGACQIFSAEGDDSSERRQHVHSGRHSYTVGHNPYSLPVSGRQGIGRTPSLDSIHSANPHPAPSKPPLPTPVLSERSFSLARPGHERDDELPLPIKSQRKQHISFPRSTFS